MPDISRLVIEVDSKGVLTATGNLEIFAKMGQKAGKSADDLANKMGAFQLIANKLPGPLKSIASGLMGLVSPSTAVVSAFLEIGEAAVKYIKESIQAYQEHEVQLVRLEAVLKATGAAAWTSSSELANHANSLQASTGRSSNEIMQMQSVLLGFTNITDENFTRLTKNMLDMADVMGGSLTAAANTFGKAMDTPTESLSALSRYGFKFTEEQKRMVKAMEEANNVAGAQVIILESMEKAFGGAAEATGKTIDGLKRIVKELKEQNKALTAEKNGWADWNKSMLESQAEALKARNEEIAAQIKLQELQSREKKGGFTFYDELERSEILIETLTKQIDYIERGIIDYGNQTSDTYYTYKDNLQEALDIKTKIQEKYGSQLSAMEQLIKRQKDFNIALREAERTNSNMNETITSAYERTQAFKIEQTENEIRKLEAILKNPVQAVQKLVYDTNGLRGLDEFVVQELSDKQIKELREGLAQYYKELENLKKGSKDNPFDDWVKVLSQATGYTNEIVKGFGGLKTVETFSTDIDNLIKRMEVAVPGYEDGGLIYEILGLNKSELYDDAADKMRRVVSAMTESGIWNTGDASYIRAIELLKQLDENAMTKRGENYLSNLTEELADAGKSSYELAVKRLMIEQKISEEAAREAIETQKKIDYIKNGYDYMGNITESIDDALRSIRSGNGGYGEYAGGRFSQVGMNLIQGSDAGNFVQGMEMGGPIVGLLNMLAGALENVLGGMEGIDIILSPITGLLTELSDVIKTFMLPLLIVSKLIVAMGTAINWLLNFITLGFFNKMADTYDLLVGTNNERQREEERLRALNEQYTRLLAVIKEQEEYYLQQRRHLNSEWSIEQYQTTPVNDMILSPHGVFSTDPKDYIIATKHPESLMSGDTAPVNITIINNANATVSTQEQTNANGAREIQVIIDGLVQQGMASGKYDDAFNSMTQRRNGKRVHV
jgi:hypothetical protein